MSDFSSHSRVKELPPITASVAKQMRISCTSVAVVLPINESQAEPSKQTMKENFFVAKTEA